LLRDSAAVEVGATAPRPPTSSHASLDPCVGWRSVAMGIAALNTILRFGLRRLL